MIKKILVDLIETKTNEEFICGSEVFEKETEIKLDNIADSEKDVNEVGTSLSITQDSVFKLPSAVEIVVKGNDRFSRIISKILKKILTMNGTLKE